MLGADILKQQKLLMSDIMTLGMLVNEETEHDIFLDFAGHVNQLRITIHVGGWQTNHNCEASEIYFIGKWTWEQDDGFMTKEYSERQTNHYLEKFVEVKNNLLRILESEGETDFLPRKELTFTVATLYEEY